MAHLPHTYSSRCRPVYCIKIKRLDIYVNDFDILEKYVLLGPQKYARLIYSGYKSARSTAEYLSKLVLKKLVFIQIGWREEYFTFIPSSHLP